MDCVGLEDAVLGCGGAWLDWWAVWVWSWCIGRAYDCKDAVEVVSGGLVGFLWGGGRRDVRPHLTALFWHDCEAELFAVELEPDIFAE